MLRNLFQESRSYALFRHVIPITAAIARARDDERIHGARHAYVAKPALFFELVRIEQRARMWEQAFFQADEADERELQALWRNAASSA